MLKRRTRDTKGEVRVLRWEEILQEIDFRAELELSRLEADLRKRKEVVA